MRKKTTFILIFCLLLIGSIILFSINYINKKSQANSQIVLFYSLQCTHCKPVEDFLRDNNVHAKINFVEKEITQNKDNLKELIKISKECDTSPRSYVEIPLLWTGSKCLIGTDEVINFFKEKITAQ